MRGWSPSQRYAESIGIRWIPSVEASLNEGHWSVKIGLTLYKLRWIFCVLNTRVAFRKARRRLHLPDTYTGRLLVMSSTAVG